MVIVKTTTVEAIITLGIVLHLPDRLMYSYYIFGVFMLVRNMIG
jgi:hypothetical protein